MKKILFLSLTASLLISCSSYIDEPVIITDPVKEILQKLLTSGLVTAGVSFPSQQLML